MSQSTDVQRFALSPVIFEAAEANHDPNASRLRGLEVRVIQIDDQPWFVARDVCVVLDIRNVPDAMTRLDDDQYQQVAAAIVSTDARPQDRINVVSESGLYSLIMGSRKPVTRPFRRWVTDEVLPAIRKTGTYAVPAAPKTRVELVRELLAAEERAEEAERAAQARGELLIRAHGMLREVEPKVAAHDALLATDRDWCMRDAAAILNRDPEIWKRRHLGQNSLFAVLRDFGMVDNTNRIYASHKQHLRILPTTYQHPHTGEPRASEQLRLTALGLVYLQGRLGGSKPAALRLDESPVTVS